MPEDSALAAAYAGGPEHRGWTTQTHLLAQILNTLRFADANNVRVNGGKLSQKPKPVDVPIAKSGGKPKKRLSLAGNPLAKPIPIPRE